MFDKTQARRVLRRAQCLRQKLAQTEQELDRHRVAYMRDSREYGVSRERFEAAL